MDAPLPDYFPLAPGSILDYATKTPSSWGTLRVEVLSVSKRGPRLIARCRHTAFEDDRAKVKEVEVVNDGSAVLSRGYMEFPLPPAVGSAWDAYPRAYEIETDRAEVDLPAGHFADCLKVAYLIAGGDGGSGFRLYAPGVGFVHESCDDEASPFKVSLTRLRLPETRHLL